MNSAEAHLNSMQDKDRIQLKELAQNIATKLHLDAKDVLGFVTYFARNTNLGYVSRGKNGGLIKGSRPTKPTPQSSDSDDSDSEE
jgi:hypothetical protein